LSLFSKQLVSKRLTSKQLALIFTLIITLLPYTLLSSVFEISVTFISNFALFLLQFICLAYLSCSYLKTSSKSLKIFWLYLSLAVLSSIISHLLSDKVVSLSQLLINDFSVLCIYFFILLAIETNPHLSDAPLNNYSNGRVPAIFFAVISFSYFVLLPAEFDESIYLTLKPSLFFHLIMNTLIFLRLVVCLVNCQSNFWRIIFALLTLVAGFILISHGILFDKIGTLQPKDSSYFTSLLQLMPYTLLIFAANKGLNKAVSEIHSQKESKPDIYILILMFSLAFFHLYGHEYDTFYAVNSNLQSGIVLLWLFIGSTLLINIAWQRTIQNQKLKKSSNALHHDHSQLIELNQQLTDALINSEDKAIVRASNNAILTTSTTGEILSANPSAVQMFQSLEQELKGSLVSKLFSEKDEMHYFFDYQSNVFSLQRKDLGISVECVSLRSDGSEFPAQAELQWAEREEQPLIVITFINLTARKLAEKQTLELKDKFIANISHEFRTPLTIINGIIDRYLVKTDKEEESEDLTTAKRNGLRLVRMVEQLLELSRLSDNPSLTLSTYRLSALMGMPIDSFSRLAIQSKLSFSNNIPDDLWINCDAQAFEKIIFNLLSNAVKYTPAGGSIKVIAYLEQDSIIIDVIDSGIGINKNSQEVIFERFQRADDPLNKSAFGVGIGLSLVNELVKAQGWRINLVSEQGHGSKFSLAMPNEEPNEIEQEIPFSLSENEVTSLLVEQKTVSTAQTHHTHQVVLVIEDNVDMQTHIKQVIEQQHHCILAGNGEVGLQLAQEYLPDLIVCDLMLTGIDGFEVLKQLKADDMTAHIPVILLTARSDLESRLQGLHLNADEYLSKPFNQHELLTRIQNLIENRKSLQQNYFNKFKATQKEERKENSQKNAAKLVDNSDEQVSLDDKFLIKLESAVAKIYAEPNLDISSLSEKLAMSERQLQRKIKVLLGTNPNNFIKEFRLRKAQELLKNGSQIGRIALDVGFSSQTYFGRCFKETFKCTPKQYQQSLNNSADVVED